MEINELDRQYLSDLIQNDIKFAPAKRKYDYVADLEMAITQHVEMIDKIGKMVVALNERGLGITERTFNIIKKLAAESIVVNPYQ